MNIEPWYGIKCIFRHLNLDTEEPGAFVYEERIVLVSASSDDEAISLAEKDAIDYAKDTVCEYLEFATSFHIFDDKVVSLSEVYSEMRESSLEPDEYLDYFYDTGNERVKK